MSLLPIQFAESPQPGGSIGSLRGNVLVASEPTGDGRPTGGGAADKFGIQHGQTEETQATERLDTLEALHFHAQGWPFARHGYRQ